MYIYCGFDPSRPDASQLSCELRDSGGKIILRGGFSIDGRLPGPCWLALPHDSTLRFRPCALCKGMASDGEWFIYAGFNSWRIPRGDTNDYYLSGTLTLSIPQGETRPRTPEDKYSAPSVWQGTLKLPPVKIPARKPSSP